MEIFLASTGPLYAFRSLYWYSIFGFGAFSVFCCGKLLQEVFRSLFFIVYSFCFNVVGTGLLITEQQGMCTL